jgi:pimeloyl-ACP methyl ester carboxylesterase
MPSTLLDGKTIHYEVHGGGEPVIFLNGALMTTESWGLHVEAFSKRYMLIRMDFFGQGQSEIMTHEYTQDLQVEAIRAVLDALELSQVHMFSSSYGAQVALGFALKYQQRVKSLIFQGVKSYADDPHSRAVGQFWIDVAEECDPGKLWDAIVPRVYGADFYNNCIEILNQRKALFRSVLSTRPREWYAGWARLIRSCCTYNVRDRLHEIHVPTLVVAGELDKLVPLNLQREVHDGIPGSEYLVLCRQAQRVPGHRLRFPGGTEAFVNTHNLKLTL